MIINTMVNKTACVIYLIKLFTLSSLSFEHGGSVKNNPGINVINNRTVNKKWLEFIKLFIK